MLIQLYDCFADVVCAAVKLYSVNEQVIFLIDINLVDHIG